MKNEPVLWRTTSGPGSEWPLVAFTTLAIVGAGVLAAPLIAVFVEPMSMAAAALRLPGTALLAAGLLVSLAHLGSPRRARLALEGMGRSRLSTEVALAGLTLIAGAAAMALPAALAALTLVPSACAIAFLVALGLVYDLPGQHAWRGAVVLSPAVTGLAIGAVALAGRWPRIGTRFIVIAAAILAADLATSLLRALRLERTGRARPVHPGWFARRRPLLAARLALVDVLPLALLAAGLPKGAAGMLGLGILVDRLAFYLLAVRRTTDSDVQAAEGAIP